MLSALQRYAILGSDGGIREGKGNFFSLFYFFIQKMWLVSTSYSLTGNVQLENGSNLPFLLSPLEPSTGQGVYVGPCIQNAMTKEG